jgi:hypothetical protein
MQKQNAKRRGRGRPTRAEAAARRIAAQAATEIDPSSVDPRKVLAQIAADTSAPSAARVTACRLLMEDEEERRARKEWDATHDDLGLMYLPGHAPGKAV